MSNTPKTTAADAYETMEALLCEMQGLRDELVDVKRERDEARAQYQTTHLLAEVLAKTQVELVAERDELREKNKTLSRCWREAEQERDEFRMRLEAGK